MINIATVPEVKLHKRQNILCFNFVKNIFAAQYINLWQLESKFNISDILSKHWSYQSVYYNLLKPVFYYKGNMWQIFGDDLLYVDYYTNIDDNDELIIDGKF